MALDPITGAFELGTAALNTYAGSRANAIARQNLEFQRQSAADQQRFARAGRTDAFGNRVSFNDALNEWITQLAPEQQRIVKAGEHEQLLGLTDDAAQNRLIREQQFRRGRAAGDDYTKALSGFRYDQPPSEASTRDELTRLMTNAAGLGNNVPGAYQGNEGIRQAGHVPIIRTGGNGAQRGTGSDLAQIMLNARTGAMGEHMQRDQAHASKYLPTLEQFQRTMDMGGNAPINMANQADALSSREDQMAKAVAEAMRGGATGVGNAATLNTRTQQTQFPSMSDVARLIAAGNRGGGQSGSTGSSGTDYFGGSPGTNSRLNPATYGNIGQDLSGGDFIF